MSHETFPANDTDAALTVESPSPEGTAAPTVGDIAATMSATLIDEWVALGLQTIVISPGSRSTPLALAACSNDNITTHICIDERGAAFTALGVAQRTQRPVAVLCTSGSATTHFHGAVVEANHAAIPLLVLTADRPPELHGVGAPQTIDQQNLYGTAVRSFVHLDPPELQDASQWRGIARDAWSQLLGNQPGPVHINLAFREPLVGSPLKLPPRTDTSSMSESPFDATTQQGLNSRELEDLQQALSGKEGVLICGTRAAVTDDEARAILTLSAALRWPVIADGMSGCRRDVPTLIAAAETLLRSTDVTESLQPEVIVHFGGPLASKQLYLWCAGSDAKQFGIDRFAMTSDPYDMIPNRIRANPAMAAKQLTELVTTGDEADRIAPCERSWVETWREFSSQAEHAMGVRLRKYPDTTEVSTVIDAVSLLAEDGNIVASSSMPVRDLEWFSPVRGDLRYFSNRGTNGIDGVLSTAFGVALSGEPTIALVGDVAFLHDVNALAHHRDRDVNLVIVVINNDGGGIFSFLSQRELCEPAVFERVFGTPHGNDIAAVASGFGVSAETFTSRTGFQAGVTGALTRGGVHVLVSMSDRDINTKVHRDLLNVLN